MIIPAEEEHPALQGLPAWTWALHHVKKDKGPAVPSISGSNFFNKITLHWVLHTMNFQISLLKSQTLNLEN